MALTNQKIEKWFGSYISHFNFHVIKIMEKTFTSVIVSSIDSKLLEGVSVLLLKKKVKECLKKILESTL